MTKTLAHFLAESPTFGTIPYRGKTIRITDDAFEYSEGGKTWTRNTINGVKDLIDSLVNAKLPPKRWWRH